MFPMQLSLVSFMMCGLDGELIPLKIGIEQTKNRVEQN